VPPLQRRHLGPHRLPELRRHTMPFLRPLRVRRPTAGHPGLLRLPPRKGQGPVPVGNLDGLPRLRVTTSTLLILSKPTGGDQQGRPVLLRTSTRAADTPHRSRPAADPWPRNRPAVGPLGWLPWPADRWRVQPAARNVRMMSAARRLEGIWREIRPATAARPSRAKPRFRTSTGCGRDRIRTCVGEAGGFTDRMAASPPVPSRRCLAPILACDVRKRPAGSFPVPRRPRPGRPVPRGLASGGGKVEGNAGLRLA
jgi:hypothetical protein